MRRQSWISAVLAAALLLGQALAAAHNPDHHDLLPGAAHGCAICVYAHGVGHGALPAAPALVLDAPAEAPVALRATAHVTLTVSLHPIRGPPVLLA